MYSHQRARGKILFEVLVALSLAASFAGAWDQTGSPALLASASIMALFAVYWSFGLVSRDRSVHAAQPVAAVAEAREFEVVAAAPEPILAPEPEAPVEPEPVAPAPKKPRARKAKKSAADTAPVVEQQTQPAEPVSNGLPIEQLFETQPFVRQPRAFGRKARGPRTLPAV